MNFLSETIIDKTNAITSEIYERKPVFLPNAPKNWVLNGAPEKHSTTINCVTKMSTIINIARYFLTNIDLILLNKKPDAKKVKGTRRDILGKSTGSVEKLGEIMSVTDKVVSKSSA